MAEGDFPRNDDLPSAQEVFDAIKRHKRWIFIGVGVLIVVFLAFNSYFQVEPEEKAVVLRFGEPQADLYGPGLHFKIPLVDEVYKVKVEEQKRIEFGIRTRPGEETRVDNYVPEESLMLTGDLQLVHVRWSIIYKVVDPTIWLFEVKPTRDLKTNQLSREATIRDISESIMRQLVGDYSLHEVLTVKLRQIQDEARIETNRALRDDVPTGVIITELAIQNTDVPPEAKVKFDEFNKTEPKVKEILSTAKAEQSRVTGAAELKKKRAIGEAQQRYQEVTKNALGEAEAFQTQLQRYLAAPEITRQWMYLQSMDKVMAGVEQKIILDGTGQGANTLNVLPLGEMLGGKPGSGSRAIPGLTGGK
ncbi:MAG: membrane protease subunit HflK [Myxococcota bacterium]|jgi:membrane protease subunit HflK